jgi:hypothetical protein
LPITDARIVELIRQHAPNTAAFEVFRPHRPKVIRGIILGAQIVGLRGHQDRMTMFRMMGLPWTTGAAFGRGQASGGDMDAMADRIARAVTRREGRLLGRDPVTIDVPTYAEPASEAAEVE